MAPQMDKITERDEDMWRSGYLAGLREALEEIKASDSVREAWQRVNMIPFPKKDAK